MNESKKTLVCCECGGTDIMGRFWVGLNDNIVGEPCDDDAWCEDCQAEVSLETKED